MVETKKMEMDDPGVDWKKDMEVYLTRDDDGYVVAIPLYTYSIKIEKGEGVTLQKFPNLGDVKKMKTAITEVIEGWW